VHSIVLGRSSWEGGRPTHREEVPGVRRLLNTNSHAIGPGVQLGHGGALL